MERFLAGLGGGLIAAGIGAPVTKLVEAWHPYTLHVAIVVGILMAVLIWFGEFLDDLI